MTPPSARLPGNVDRDEPSGDVDWYEPADDPATKTELFLRRRLWIEEQRSRRESERHAVEAVLRVPEQEAETEKTDADIVYGHGTKPARKQTARQRKQKRMDWFTPKTVTGNYVAHSQFPFKVPRPNHGPQLPNWASGLNLRLCKSSAEIIRAWVNVLDEVAARRGVRMFDVLHAGAWRSAQGASVGAARPPPPVFVCGVDPSSASGSSPALTPDTHLCAEIMRALDNFLSRTIQMTLKRFENQAFLAVIQSTAPYWRGVSRRNNPLLGTYRLARLGTTATLGKVAGGGDPACYSILLVFTRDRMWNTKHGQGNLVFPDQDLEIEVRPGDVIFFQGNERHFVRPLDEGDRHRYLPITINTTFDPDLHDELAEVDDVLDQL